MTHPKNSTTPIAAQRPSLVTCAFGPDYSDFFSVGEGGDLCQALSIAADLSDGVSQLCGRLDHCINDGEIAFCSEVRALGFISAAVSTLVRSAQRGLQVAVEVQAESAQ